MNSKLRKFLASLIVIAMLFGWYVSIFGIGSLNSIKDAMKFGLDINGGVYVVMEADTDATGEELTQLMDQTREVLNNRVNAMGIAEATVSVEGDKRIRVEMPGVSDADEAITQIGQTAQLRFLLANGKEVLTGDDVRDASIDTDSEHGGYKINLEFTSEGATKFESGTAEALQGVTPTITDSAGVLVSSNAVVIMLDDEVITAPTVSSTITSTSCEITSGQGGYSKEEASQTAALIRGGALPVSLHEVSSSVQTATIGEDALNKSVVAGLIGLGLVFLLMLVMYRMLGLIANIALLLYVMIVLWIMASMGSVLTLPGIAGIILSIGMAVDANVIIFARIKDEIGQGKSIRVAVDQGFKHALTTVLDAQITTLIASVVLYEIGSTTVKGFALTLMIGIVVSIFTAVVVTQLFIGLIANSKRFAKNKYFGCAEDGTPKKIIKKEFKFIEKRKIFYCISAGIIIVGLVFTVVRGFNYGIDFTGGTMIQVQTTEKVSANQVQDALAEYDLNATVVFSGDDQKQVVIKTTEALENSERTQIVESLKTGLNDDAIEVQASEEFGPTIGNELKTNALKAVIIAAIGMLIYIIFRFKSWKYGVASIAGIAHDVLILLSCYAIFNITINNPFIAGVLTVVGYSINDTIVIFDRIRENKRLMHKETNLIVLNKSINQTLNRSIMTSLTTLVCMIPLFLMVSSSIREFVLPLMVGVLVGTYSSIFLCSPLFYEFNKKEDTSKYMATQRALEKKESKEKTKTTKSKGKKK